MARTSYDLDDLTNEVDGLYRLAQGLAKTPRQAAALVETTYNRAQALLSRGHEPDDLSLWLRYLLIQLADESPNLSSRPPQVERADGFRQRAFKQLVRNAMPAAFSSLPAQRRSLLLLCKVDKLSCADAASILNMHPDAAAKELSDSLAELRYYLYEIASPPERKLLDHHLSSSLLVAALKHFVATSFEETPESLRPETVWGSSSRTTSTARRASEQPEQEESSSLPAVDWSGIGQRIRQTAVVLVLIVMTGVIGYAAATFFEAPEETNLLALSVQERQSVHVQETITDAEQATAFIYEELGIRLTPPAIQGAELQGVDITEIATDVHVPVLLFRDTTTDAGIPVYAYTYGQLNRYENRIVLSDSVLRRIENEGQIVEQEVGGSTALIWRQRDKILVAIPAEDPGQVRARIQPAI